MRYRVGEKKDYLQIVNPGCNVGKGALVRLWRKEREGKTIRTLLCSPLGVLRDLLFKLFSSSPSLQIPFCPNPFTLEISMMELRAVSTRKEKAR